MTNLTEHELAEVPKPFRYVPPFPERTAYHWIRRYRGGPAIPLWWNAIWNRNGSDGWGQWAQPDREDKWEYCGPCRSPDDPPMCNPALPREYSTATDGERA
jgi:hypothetical protein